jgi:hypothetical protein
MSAVKIVVLILLVVILASLASALFHMIRRKSDSRQMAKALTVRISLSIALLLMIIAAGSMGWMKPHSLILTTPQTNSIEEK